MSEKTVDYKLTEIGKQNWEVCSRMLMHDLMDLSEDIPELDAVLKHYRVAYTEHGSYTMALPRLGSIVGHRDLTLTDKLRGPKKR